ncbi:unnamed protein product, partial [Rotaria sp. Silwood2]
VEIQKIADINHFVKRLKHTLQVIKYQCGNKKLSDGKPIGGKGRNTDQMILRFQIYFCDAIRKNKHDIDELYKIAQLYRLLYSKNITISFNDERLHTEKKEYMRKQRKLMNLHQAIKDTSEEDNNNADDTEDVSDTFDQENDNYDNNDGSSHGSYHGGSSDDGRYDDSDEEKNDSSDENNDDGETQQEEDLYYNPTSRKWKHSSEDN